MPDLKLHVADFRTGEPRRARHEMSRSDSAANDSVEREGNPRKRRTGAMVVSRKVKKGFVVYFIFWGNNYVLLW